MAEQLYRKPGFEAPLMLDENVAAMYGYEPYYSEPGPGPAPPPAGGQSLPGPNTSDLPMYSADTGQPSPPEGVQSSAGPAPMRQSVALAQPTPEGAGGTGPAAPPPAPPKGLFDDINAGWRDIINAGARAAWGVTPLPGGEAAPAGAGAGGGPKQLSLEDYVARGRNSAPRRGGGGGVRQIRPEREARVGYQIESSEGPSAESLAAMDRSGKEFDAASATVASQKADRQLAELSLYDADNVRLAWQIQEEKNKRARIDAEIGALKYKADQREAQAEKMTDPTVANYWKEKGMAARMLGGISVFLSGYLRGLKGSDVNTGAQIIDNNINQWIAGEKEKYQRARGRVSDAHNAYAEALNRWGTPEAAEADMRMRSEAVLQRMMKTQTAKLMVPEEQAAALEAIAARGEPRARARAALDAANAAKVTEMYRLQPAQYAGGGAPKGRSQVVRLPNRLGGGEGYALPKADADKLRERITTNEISLQGIEEMEHLMADSSVPLEAKRARATAIATRIGAQINVALGQRAMTDHEAKFRLGELGDPQDWIHPNGIAKLRQTKSNIEQTLLQEVRDNVTQDPEGTTWLLDTPDVQRVRE